MTIARGLIVLCCMFLQCCLFLQCCMLAADATVVGTMGLEVRPEAGRLREGPAAVLALVGLLPCVEPLVAPEGGGLAERPQAVLALVGSLPRVDARVGPQAALGAEHPLALLALPPAPVLVPREHPVHQAGRAGLVHRPERPGVGEASRQPMQAAHGERYVLLVVHVGSSRVFLLLAVDQR